MHSGFSRLVPRMALWAMLLATPAGAQVGELIAPNVVRFHASEEAAREADPSLALETPLEPIGPAPEGFDVEPVFAQAEGVFEIRVDVEAGTSLYGTGEVAGRLLRNGRVITCWNYDAYGYDDDSEHLYQSHPWVLALRPDGTAYGVLADTTYRVEVDLTSAIEFRVEGPACPVIVIAGDHPRDVVESLADITGTMPMPPKWALGYHQCRYSYFPDDRVREIATQFRDREIPCDVIWMDIDYMDGFRCFTFDPELFPDPEALNDDLHEMDFHSVWMIDPGIKLDPGYDVYDSGTERDVWVKTAAGETYVGEVWPGDCVFPDYTNAAVREWWAGLYEEFISVGVDGVWNDMNEPAVFNVQSKTMPLDNHHRADEDLGGPGPHAKYHNVYGMLMVKATREGIAAARPETRPFVLSRANYIGGHRYAATWTGDNTADWYHLESSVPMVLNMGLSGNPFTGPDIGGFAGNGPPGGEDELFARWMGIGAMLPFARGHTGKGNIDKEPWSFGPEVERTCRRALVRRYKLMPYLYTLFQEASTTGVPVARPLFFHDPVDRALRSEDDAFLLGDDLLVVCDMTPGREREPALPRGDWNLVDFDRDPELPELRIRAGAIIPVGPSMEYVDEKPLDPISLIVSLDGEGKARGRLYEDAGDGYEYLEGGFLETVYGAELVGDAIRITIEGEAGDLVRPDRRIEVHVATPSGLEWWGDGVDGKRFEVRRPDS